MSFKYNDKVKVTKGFYSGSQGTLIHDYKPVNPATDNRKSYAIEIVRSERFYKRVTVIGHVYEDELELAPIKEKK